VGFHAALNCLLAPAVPAARNRSLRSGILPP
jgi:hypothetical protein